MHLNPSFRNKRQRIVKNKKLFVLCIVIALIGAGAFLKPRSRAQSVSRTQVSDHVLYRHVFHHVLALKKRAEEAENNGDDGTQYRTHFKRHARLNDAEAAMLERVAIEYDEREKVLDAQAKVIIDAYKARFPNGQMLNHPTPPPAELRSLSLERDALVLRSRDQLRSALGSDFPRFESFVKTRISADSTLQSR
jgi:hypothetical protein